MIVIADPDADNEMLIEPDEPGVRVVLRGSSLARGKALQRRGTAGAGPVRMPAWPAVVIAAIAKAGGLVR